ncbi:MAG: PorT family protein [Phaeodactylibacter sp.]|nr:PorT family protein [Phaeodactylibacter sp.]MCB9265922.1 PorT family protein [Lewinellaceae bacterium]MCB9289722.1 PorT family protein [Lewinellaceae bacterium]
MHPFPLCNLKILKWGFTALVFFILFPCSSYAQTYFGFKAGPNISHLRMTKIPSEFGDSSLGQLYGFQAGMVVEQPINGHLVLGAELLGAMKGGQWSLDPIGTPGALEFQSELYYLNLPVFLRLIPIERWSLDVGLEGGYRLGSSEAALFMERADFSWLLGASFQISRSFLASLRYSLGNVRVGEGHFVDEETGINGVYYFRTRSLQLSVAYFW